MKTISETVKRIGRGVRFLSLHGVRATWKKLKFQRNFKKASQRIEYTEADFARQRKTVFPRDIKFSIIVPIYNTPLPYLREMIQSVLNQTYQNWELCLADGSDMQHTEVGEEAHRFMESESRIRYQKLEQNFGISGNTNACIDMSRGDYLVLLDHDDVLHQAALFEVMRAICGQNADLIYTDELTFLSPNLNDVTVVHYKPDFAPDNLKSNNYICHLTVFERSLLIKTGKFRSEYDGSQDHDMILRLTEQAKKIVHIPKVLYYWRSHPNSVAQNVDNKDYAIKAAHAAIEDSLKRNGIDNVKVESTRASKSIYRLRYPILKNDLVSIIIPNKNHLRDLKKCINSILSKTTYPNYEIVIVDNDSNEKALFDYYEELATRKNVTLCYLNIPFNYSIINNYAVSKARGEYYLLLNNDVEVITPNWIEEMLMFVQRKDVGAAGAMLYYPNNTVQHAGVLLGLRGIAGHYFRNYERGNPGYMGRLAYAQNVSAVTAACMLIKASVYHQVGELDERFEVAFNDVDLCMKIRKAGYLIVWTPFAELYHFESKSRGYEDTVEKQKRFLGEIDRFLSRWGNELKAGDPYYNPNLSLNSEDFYPNT